MSRPLPHLSLALALFALPAFAHPDHGGAIGELGAGLVHPLLGIDHALATRGIGAAVAGIGLVLLGAGT